MTYLLRNVWAWRVVVLMGIASLMLPMYGPLLDPGYAENIPGHSHIVFDGGSLAAHQADPNGPTDDGVAAVPGPGDGFGYAVVLAAATVALVTLAGPSGAGAVLRTSLARSPRAPKGLTSAPLPPPPKALVV